MSVESFSTPTATPNQTVEAIHFTGGGSIHVNAPAEKVFNVITNFAKYGEGNSWCPGMSFKDADVKVGSEGSFVVKMEAQNRTYNVPCRILTLERSPTRYVLAWRGLLLPGWAGTAERVQEVIAETNGGCAVKNWESMSGVACYVLRLMGVPAQLAESNKVYLEDLKKAAERA